MTVHKACINHTVASIYTHRVYLAQIDCTQKAVSACNSTSQATVINSQKQSNRCHHNTLARIPVMQSKLYTQEINLFWPPQSAQAAALIGYRRAEKRDSEITFLPKVCKQISPLTLTLLTMTISTIFGQTLQVSKKSRLKFRSRARPLFGEGIGREIECINLTPCRIARQTSLLGLSSPEIQSYVIICYNWQKTTTQLREIGTVKKTA